MSVEAGRETSVEYLLLTFDVPAHAEASGFIDDLGHLQSLYTYCEYITVVQSLKNTMFLAEPMFPSLRVARMRYGSPWQLLLTGVGEKAPYVASAGVLFYGSLRALQAVLQMKMNWDNHRKNLERQAFQLEHDKTIAAIDIVQQLNDAYGYNPESDETPKRPTMSRASYDLASLPPVTEVEIVRDDDPRV